jgi:hypothetical protein
MIADRSMTVVLALDGVYYLEARHRTQSAQALGNEYNRWAKEINETNTRIELVEARCADPTDAYDEIEADVIKTDRDWECFRPVALALAQNAAAAQILCAACLEAHINMRAEAALPTKDFDEFDKLAVTGKWLLYPKIVHVGSFDPGTEPFQSFQSLVRRRNSLVHYKARTERRKHPYEVPDFVQSLGLDGATCLSSLAIVERMVTDLAEMEHRAAPAWLAARWDGIFDFGL